MATVKCLNFLLQKGMDAPTIGLVGLLLIFVGFAIIFLTMISLVLKTMKGPAKVKGGGFILLGPFPIAFGTDKELLKPMAILLIVSIITIVIITALLRSLL